MSQVVERPYVVVQARTGVEVTVIPYGYDGSSTAQYEIDAASADHPRQVGLSPHRMIEVQVVFKQARPWAELVTKLVRCKGITRGRGWQITDPIPGVAGTGSCVGGTTVPDNPSLQSGSGSKGFGFSFEAEQPDKAAAFTEDDMASLNIIALQVLSLV